MTYLNRYGSDGLSITHLFEPSSRSISALHAPSSGVDDDEEGAGAPVTLCRNEEEPEEDAMKET